MSHAGSSATDVSMNAGQLPFNTAAPTGFSPMSTANLPDPAITDPKRYFGTLLYTGNGSSRSITGVGFKPSLSWFKSRSNASDHYWYDSIRGANKSLSSNDTGVEDSTSGQFTQFTATGFDLPADNAGYVNYTGRTYVAWNWRAGGEPTADNSAGAGNTPTSVVLR